MTGAAAIGPAGWAFLAFALLALPLAAGLFAIGERRRGEPRAAADDAPTAAHQLSRIALYVQAMFTHLLLLAGALAAAWAEGVVLFPRVTIGARELLAAALTLVAVVAIGELSWRSRSPAERERLWVRRLLPRTPAERRTWVVVAAGAAIAEEVAYRGAVVAFIVALTGSLSVAVLASAAAFAAVHAPQGFAGIGYVFVIALLHQALVLVTGTLLLAIAVHFGYDLLAGLWLARRHGLTTVVGSALRRTRRC